MSPCLSVHVFAHWQMCLHVNMHAYVVFPPISRVTNQTWPDPVSQWKLVAGRWNTETLYKEPPYYQHPLVNVSQLCICFIYTFKRSCHDILCNRMEFILKNETM